MDDADRLSKLDATKAIRDCVETGRVRLTRHFRDELMMEELTVGAALHVIQHGYVFKEPEYDVKFGQWRYRMEGTEPDGKYVGIVFAFEETKDGVLITIFSIGVR